MTGRWPLKTPPDEYLEQYGLNAKNSALAIEMLSEQEEVEFAVGSWDGHPNYHCPVCPVSMLDLDEMRAHVRGHGTRRPSLQPEEE